MIRPAPSDSRATARPSSGQEDATAGLKHAYVGGSEQRKRREKRQWCYRTVSPSIPISTTFRIAHAADDFDDPFIKDIPTRRFLDMSVPIIFSYRYSLLAEAKSRARGQIPPALIEALLHATTVLMLNILLNLQQNLCYVEPVVDYMLL
ncbi:hypothetical protein K435DRAFT_793036 [Dendrothele bispora CBS 962.96]|uniref:Uncharacterized protein n=1 Tax=Dendrothele bispora (strain CBS 962.96) TaxID=1314807 RepID=A0A4S8MGZ0_DENBC|nr:hypothetical protein K435DRAFT_793036 [Dendrothele bispora CBS 962.96]